MKKTGLLVALALLGVAAIPLAACDKTPKQSEGKTETGTYYGIQSAESIYGVAAVTTAKLLAASAPAGVTPTAQTVADSSISKALDEVEDFNKYFNMLDSFLVKSATKTVVEPNDSADEAVREYDYRLTVTGKDAEGGDVTHFVYFSETAGAPTHNRYTDGDETVTVEETVYTLRGAVDMGRTEDGTVYYQMTGTRAERTVTEKEGRETETEHIATLNMKAYDDPASGDYVALTHTQTTEEEGRESETESLYTYRVYSNNALVEATEVGFETETEHGGTESEYSIRFLEGGRRGSYEIEHETVNGKTVIEVEYNIDGTRGKFTVGKDGEYYRYRFSDDGTYDRNFRDFDD